jgi:hypothetical protein
MILDLALIIGLFPNNYQGYFLLFIACESGTSYYPTFDVTYTNAQKKTYFLTLLLLRFIFDH